MEWLGKPGVVQLDKITLIDEKSGRVFPAPGIDRFQPLAAQGAYRGNGGYENLDAVPRAWLVPEAVPVNPQDILHISRRNA